MKRIVLWTSACAVLAVLAFLSLGGESAPHQPTDAAQATPDTVAEGAALADVALPAELSASAQIGQRVFDASCSTCHGANAAGRDGYGPPLVHRIYEPGHHADIAFPRAVENGVRSHHWPFGDMPAVTGLTNADVSAVVRYIRELQAENSIL